MCVHGHQGEDVSCHVPSLPYPGHLRTSARRSAPGAPGAPATARRVVSRSDDSRQQPATLLEAERQAALDRLAALERDHVGIVEAAGSANNDDEHDPEGATIAFEREHVAALLDQTREHLGQVDAALRRLDEGRYGQCERCGQPIAAGRLEARPTATACISCAASADPLGPASPSGAARTRTAGIPARRPSDRRARRGRARPAAGRWARAARGCRGCPAQPGCRPPPPPRPRRMYAMPTAISAPIAGPSQVGPPRRPVAEDQRRAERPGRIHRRAADWRAEQARQRDVAADADGSHRADLLCARRRAEDRR